MSRLIIGLEGHDGTGKSATAKAVAKIMGGHVFFSDDETKVARQEIYKNDLLSHKQKMTGIENIYRKESLRFEKELGDKNIIIFDRTFISHSVEENVSDKYDKKRKPYYDTSYYPEDVVKPTIIFQVLIPEVERNRRVDERGEKLGKRDIKLRDDDEYRKQLESERTMQGCISLNLRLRDPETCALRLVQSLLGNESVEPLLINLN